MAIITGNMGLMVEGVLIFGGMLLFCVWQLRELKQLKKQREADEQNDKS